MGRCIYSSIIWGFMFIFEWILWIFTGTPFFLIVVAQRTFEPGTFIAAGRRATNELRHTQWAISHPMSCATPYTRIHNNLHIFQFFWTPAFCAECQSPVACPCSSGRGVGGCVPPPWTPSAGATGRRISTPASCNRRAAGTKNNIHSLFLIFSSLFLPLYCQH